MDSKKLQHWAKAHDNNADWRSDYKLSLTNKLVRFRWNKVPAVAVGADVKTTKTRINAVLDGLAWYLKTRQPGGDTLHVVLGKPSAEKDRVLFREHCDAVRTLAISIANGPTVRVWTIDEHGQGDEVDLVPVAFTSCASPTKWAGMLTAAASLEVGGVAADLSGRIAHPSFALYPKLSSLKSREPWQLRLDGLEIGSAGKQTITIKLNSKELAIPGEPRDTWRRIVGMETMTLAKHSLDEIVDAINALIAAWSDTQQHAVLKHGQKEHALEAHLLSGRVALIAKGSRLHLAIPSDDGALRAAQFPTLWGDVARPARYLDALLADDHGRPWAIELKDQNAGGGHGSYLRHGIGQAVLYRHYIRAAPGLDSYFNMYGLDRAQCQAAVAYPTPTPGAAKTVAPHQELAELFGVDVIEFPRPGTT